MSNKIIELLTSKKNDNLTIEEIAEKIGEDVKKVEGIISFLETDGIVFRQKNGRYILTEKTRLKKGIVKKTSSKGPIVVFKDGSQLQLSSKHVKNLNDGDVVLVEPYNKSGTAMIVKVLSHDVKNYVGEVIKEGNLYKVVSKNKEDVVLNEIYPLGTKLLIDEKTKNIISVLGHKDDPDTKTKEILVEYKFPISFSEKYLNELEEIPSSLTEEEIEKLKKQGTIDIRDFNLITIDGIDTKDFDDAVGYNHSMIYVSIANTTRVIKENTAIWDETLKRSISVYGPRSVEPMTHHKISNGICSLVPLEDRCTLTTTVKIDDAGNIVSYDIFPSIINNRKRTTYEDCNEHLEKGKAVSGYENYTQSLDILYDKSMLVKEKMLKEGFLNFSDTEVKFFFENHRVLELKKRHQGKAEELIEFLMILNNMVMIDYFIKNNLPFMARNHDDPNYIELKKWSILLRHRNYKSIVSDKLTPEEIMYNRSLYENSPEKEVLDKIAIKCLAKAKYGAICSGHYALGNIPYGTWTSPIRRLADFINQRIFFDALKYGNEYAINKWEPLLPHLSNLANSAERRAEKVEMKLDNIKKAEYMSNFIGTEYTGVVSEVSTSGVKVLLPNMCEGRALLSKGSYKVSKDKFILFDVNAGTKIIVGDQITVKLTKVDIEKGTLEFIKIEENKKYGKAGNKTKKKVKGR